MTTAAQPMERLLRTERRGDVLLIRMADSARRNALSVALVGELVEALQRSRLEGVRALVIASAEKAFCAGADIRDMLDSGWLDAQAGPDAGLTPPDLFEAITSDARPIIAAVDGLALGGGVELCLACDLVIAGERASFMFPELALGVLPNTALAMLPDAIGARAAADLILTRRRIDAAEAQRLGLVNELASGADPVERAIAMATDIVSRVPPTAFAAAKRILHTRLDWASIRSTLSQMEPQEWREGTTAFIQKRSPDYQSFWEGKGLRTTRADDGGER